MESPSSSSSFAVLPLGDRAARAERIATGAQGPGLVYRAALSTAGLRALCASAALVSGLAGLEWRPPSPLVFHPDAAPRYYSALRLYALASSLSQIRAWRARPSDLRWTSGDVPMGGTSVPGLPMLSHSSGRARPVQDVVLAALRDVRAEDGLSALAVVVEAAEPLESALLNTPLAASVCTLGVPSPRVIAPPVPPSSVDLPFASLPTIGSRSVDGTVLPFPLYALLTDQTRGGYSAGLALRMFIESVTAVTQRDWELATFCPVRISVTLREFLNWFYGSYTHWPTRDRWWRLFMAAAEALDRPEVRFPYDFEGNSGLLRVVSLSVIPGVPTLSTIRSRCLCSFPRAPSAGLRSIARSFVRGACGPRFLTACSSALPTTGTVRATPFSAMPTAPGSVRTIRRSTSRFPMRGSFRSATRLRACAGAPCSSAAPRSGSGFSTPPASCVFCPMGAFCRRRPSPHPASLVRRRQRRSRRCSGAGPCYRPLPPVLATRSRALRGSLPPPCRRSGC